MVKNKNRPSQSKPSSREAESVPIITRKDLEDWYNIPRLVAREAPEAGILDEPTICIKINKDWRPHITGFIKALARIDMWSGVEDEADRPVQEILKLLAEFENEDCGMEIDCGDIEDCLEESPTIIGIINKGGSGYDPENAEKPIEEGQNYPIAEEPVITPTDCGDADKDKLWGAISSFVDFCHSVNLDLFQKIAAAASYANLTAIMMEAIPLIETLPFDEAPKVIAWFFDNFGISYQSEVTTENLYEVKCALFCAAVANDCEFTIEIAMEYFLSDAGISVTLSSDFVEIAAALADALSLSGTEWFSAVTFLQLSVAALGETFINPRGLDYYLKATQAGALSGDSGWQVWCEDCNTAPTGEWLLVLDFANDYVKVADEFVVRNAFSLLKDATPPGVATLTQLYKKGAIFQRDVNGETSQRVINFSNSPSLSTSRVNWRRSDGTGVATHRVSTNVHTPASVQTTTSASFAWTTESTIVGSGFVPVSQLRIDWAFQLSSQLGESEMRYVEIRGTGALPVFAS